MYICRVRPTHLFRVMVRRTHPTIVENGLVYKRVRGASGTRNVLTYPFLNVIPVINVLT